jgi:hypothetical protein
MKHYWGKLINHWVKVKKRDGLSIPFILGSRTVLEKEFFVSKRCVQELLEEIGNSDDEEVIVLQYCAHICEYILGLADPNDFPKGIHIQNGTGKTKLIATFSTQILGKTFDEIKDRLANNYNECISNENFSRINLKWAPFSESDKETICLALIG